MHAHIVALMGKHQPVWHIERAALIGFQVAEAFNDAALNAFILSSAITVPDAFENLSLGGTNSFPLRERHISKG